MNDQVSSALRSLLKAAGGGLVTKGIVDGSGLDLLISAALLLAGLLWSAVHHKQNPTAKNGTSGAPGAMALLLLLLLPAMCLMPGCGTPKLEGGGAYAPIDTNGVATAKADYPLYLADSSFDLAYSSCQTVFDIERKNRDLLWKVSPEIKKSLDKIRPDTWKAVVDYAKARQAYMANPIPPNLSVLQEIGARMKQVAAVANALLPASSVAPALGPPAAAAAK